MQCACTFHLAQLLFVLLTKVKILTSTSVKTHLILISRVFFKQELIYFLGLMQQVVATLIRNSLLLRDDDPTAPPDDRIPEPDALSKLQLAYSGVVPKA